MTTTNDQLTFFTEIKEIIRQRQYEALRQVNASLIALYLEIGRRITQAQQEKGWGKSVVELLAKDLQNEFPGVQGYSARNLWRMRNFYIECSQDPILPPLVAEISWTKNIVRPEGQDVVMLSKAEYDNMVENIHVLGSKSNREWLLLGKRQAEAEELRQVDIE